MIGKMFWRSVAIANPLILAAGASRRARQGLARPLTRDHFRQQLQPLDSVLEIGPFEVPFVTGEGVEYFDVLDAEGLRRRAVEHGRDPAGVRPIDYVSPTGDLSIVDRRFVTIVSSHVIEHQPDLIRHLADVERLLEPNGRYAMIIPDKRYCFDHFTPETLIGDVVAAHLEGRRTHSAAAVLAQLYEAHNVPRRHWIGRHGRAPDRARIVAEMPGRLAEAERSLAGDYVDVHAWRFTPAGFRLLIETLGDLGHHGLTVDAVHETAVGDQEFFAFLRRR